MFSMLKLTVTLYTSMVKKIKQGQTIPVTGKKDWPRALRKIKRLLRQWNPEVVHCHLLQASILGLFAAWWLKIPKRIFTRLHATLHHQYHKKGILWDKICNTLATDIVAISKNVKNILVKRENVAPEKIRVIPHGFQWDEFSWRARRRRRSSNICSISIGTRQPARWIGVS